MVLRFTNNSASFVTPWFASRNILKFVTEMFAGGISQRFGRVEVSKISHNPRTKTL